MRPLRCRSQARGTGPTRPQFICDFLEALDLKDLRERTVFLEDSADLGFPPPLFDAAAFHWGRGRPFRPSPFSLPLYLSWVLGSFTLRFSPPRINPSKFFFGVFFLSDRVRYTDYDPHPLPV